MISTLPNVENLLISILRELAEIKMREPRFTLQRMDMSSNLAIAGQEDGEIISIGQAMMVKNYSLPI